MMEWNWLYKVYRIDLPPQVIFNYLGYTVTEKRIEKINNRTGFYRILEQSILQEGFRNPILVTAGWAYHQHKRLAMRIPRYLPNEMKTDYSKILICDRNGGSRLYMAQKHGLNIPCIVSDFCGRFNKSKPLYTEDEIKKYFKDPPKHIVFDERGVDIRYPHQIV